MTRQTYNQVKACLQQLEPAIDVARKIENTNARHDRPSIGSYHITCRDGGVVISWRLHDGPRVGRFVAGQYEWYAPAPSVVVEALDAMDTDAERLVMLEIMLNMYVRRNARKAEKKVNERDAVNRLTAAIVRNTPGAYVYVDRDAGGPRHTRSGWDFLVAHHGRVAFVEAKVGDETKLTDWQQYTQREVASAGCPYHTIRFSPTGDTFNLNGTVIKTDQATADHFLNT